MTDGYPLFVDLCVDVYVEYKRQHNYEDPPIEEFGQTREAVVGRIFRYINANGDDAAKDMLEFLCMINAWTEKIAYDLGKKVLKNFSFNTYKRVKSFSFIHSEPLNNETTSLRIFRFDKTIQKLLLDELTLYEYNKIFVDEVKKDVEEYFKNFLASKKDLNNKEYFYLKLWAEFIIRFSENEDALLAKYKETLAEQILYWIKNANFDSAEEILMLFINKLENLGTTENFSYAYFEMEFGRLLRAQGKYNDAYKIINSAYEKCIRLLGEDKKETVDAMHQLAISLNAVGHYGEALKFREEVLTLRTELLGDEHPDTIAAMNNLALSLNSLNRYDESLKFQEEVLKLYKKILGENHPKTLAAMHNLAILFHNLKRYDDALYLRQKVFKLYKKL